MKFKGSTHTHTQAVVWIYESGSVQESRTTALPGETTVSHILISSLFTETGKKEFLAHLNSSLWKEQVHLWDREKNVCVVAFFGHVICVF